MGKVNDQLAWYLGKEAVFADFCNGALYGGKKVIRPEELAEIQKFYQEGLRNRAGGKRKAQRERDVAKLLCRKEGMVIIAIENQNGEHLYMPLRCLEYDVEEFQKQLRRMKQKYENKEGLEAGAEFLSGIKRTDRFIPAVTMVLFHGEGEWTAANSLQEMMDCAGMDEVLKSMLMDYKLHIINLTDLDENNFETGLRELIGMMKRRGSKEEMQAYCRENAERFENMDDDTYDLICTMLHVKTLAAFKKRGRSQGKRGIDMCKAFDDWAKEERTIGKNQGIKVGERRGEKRLGTLINRLLEEGRISEARKASTTSSVRKKLYQEYGI